MLADIQCNSLLPLALHFGLVKYGGASISLRPKVHRPSITMGTCLLIYRSRPLIERKSQAERLPHLCNRQCYCELSSIPESFLRRSEHLLGSGSGRHISISTPSYQHPQNLETHLPLRLGRRAASRGVEFSGSRCEVWTRAIRATAALAGAQCLKPLGTMWWEEFGEIWRVSI